MPGPNFIMEPIGLNDEESPFLTLRSVCLDCGAVIVETTYDVRRHDFDPEHNGGEDALRCVAHWQAEHAGV